MNIKGGVTMLAVLFAVAYFMMGMIAYQLLKPDIAIQRDASHLDCSAPTWAGDKITCLILDSIIPLFIITILSTAGGIVTDQVLS